MIKNIRLWLKLAFVYVSNNRRQFFLGFFLSVLAIIFIPKIVPLINIAKPKTIGVVGNYVVSTLPKTIQSQLSFGLVTLDSTGTATAGAAVSWQATDSGKTLVFKLNNNLKWQDGQSFKSSQVNYNLKGVDVVRPDENTIEFSLKEPFAPLLTLLSQPLFKNGLVGFGPNRAVDIRLAGRFLSSIRLINDATKEQTIYKFFSTEKDLITALKLGSINEASGLHDSYGIKNSDNYSVTETIDGQSEAILFFNNQKKPFDDKTFRQGLVYALPDVYPEGESTDTPLQKDNWAIADNVKKYPQNIDLATKLSGGTSSTSADTKIVITTSSDLEPVASRIASVWNQAKIKTEVSVSDILPLNYDVYLTYIELPSDPDQYYLWHSTQTTNIAGYKSFKVDKLLEEGRKEIDPKLRKEIYANFQRAITEDVPAAFLFYPRVYTISR